MSQVTWADMLLRKLSIQKVRYIILLVWAGTNVTELRLHFCDPKLGLEVKL